MRMGTTNDLSLLQPFLTDGTQDTQGLHRGLGIENVVDDPLELEGVVGVGHQVWGICTGHVEGVSKLCNKTYNIQYAAFTLRHQFLNFFSIKSSQIKNLMVV